MEEDIRERANKLFELARNDMIRQLNELKGKHSMTGSFGGSSMMKAMLGVYEKASSEALDKCFDGINKLVEHRGAKWQRLLDQVSDALDNHVAQGPQFLKAQLPPRSQEYFEKTNQTFEPVTASLQHKLTEFREGWTAPRAKVWRERQPFAYAILLMLIGSGVTLLFQMAERILFPDNQNASKSHLSPHQ